MKKNSHYSKKLIDWYLLHKRDLPWRETQDPYKIWISEIILQQTRVDQGIEYYLRFIERFPKIEAIASADEQEILRYWQGLGYYSRARNLHATAKMIVEDFSGLFPSEYSLLLQLKGVGDYTAAAIASFAWNLPHPVVDGNVFRFLSRLLAIEEPIDTQKGKKLFTEIAGEMMDPLQAGLFNQAIMEFGALQCVPSSPDCNRCPFESQCLAHAASKITGYPVKRSKVKTQNRYLYYFHIHHEEFIYFQKRNGKGIWQHLYEFPSIESENPLKFEELITDLRFKQMIDTEYPINCCLIMQNQKHVLSHRILYANFYEIFLDEEPVSLTPYIRIKSTDIDNYPIHRLMQIYLEQRNK